ncbi:MAG: C4-dicarboxylate ABC transporter [Deltaproteobacteria bacterium GWA2_38_16]|nr:MAG: C4-dicarboxylate ABC transporter [Deltaproteobacteria bacterium GWA2_38_16]OGQ01981.1 MAG: C4-dicarboxylate ABC transporter [Deltaproteobacteria bacterium RIFCSPHIGHO2_02_FULL_38_15]OGQ33676.1 MAG: C4-dicarboxylate ABC transporter [Deltaproteobacteria bacterium RIFCSPLOWO2_01_FULL_38_9]HBQ21514.1 C4-dicarboxylate ABC transporter [Deltaproteobacteria bacterium]
MISLLFVLAFVLLALLGTPLFIIIGGVAFLCFYVAGIDLSAVIIEMYRIASAPTLLTIPLFTFAGYVMAESGTPKRLIDVAKALVGWIPGGLAIVTLLTCAFFTAFTGASGVTIIAMGGLLYPILISEKYSDKFSTGIVTTCGSLGLLFPPSLPLILYGLVANVSIDQLFMAGILPGILLIILLSLYSMQQGIAFKVARSPFVFKEVFRSLRAAAWEIPLPFIILVGIYGGYFTATEAAAVTAFYVLIVEGIIYRDISFTKDLPRIIKESMILVGSILIILGCALGLTNYLIDEQIPMKILDLMKVYITSKVMFLVVLNIFLLIVGCMMDIFSATIVVVPLIVPVAKAFGVDPIHLGIIFLTNLEIGYITPPVGINLFISSMRFRKPVLSLYVATVPFLIILLIALLIITYVPFLSTYLIHTFGLNHTVLFP